MDIHTTIDINAPAEAAWEVLGERFGAIAEWASAIQASDFIGELAEGGTRTCEVGGIGGFGPMTIHEELVLFDRDEMRLAYEAVSGLPGMIRYGINRWAVIPTGPETCQIASHATLRLAWYVMPMAPVMKMRMVADVRKLGVELKAYIEGSRVSEQAA